jgi:hypothetical protein
LTAFEFEFVPTEALGFWTQVLLRPEFSKGSLSIRQDEDQTCDFHSPA